MHLPVIEDKYLYRFWGRIETQQVASCVPLQLLLLYIPGMWGEPVGAQLDWALVPTSREC